MVEIGMGIMIVIILTILWVLYFLYNPIKTKDFNAETSNIELGKQKLSELEVDLKNGLIDSEYYEQAKEDIANVLANELGTGMRNETLKTKVGFFPILMIVFLIPTFSIGLYELLGAEKKVDIVKQEKQVQREGVTYSEMEEKIKSHLLEKPNDFEALKSMGFLSIEQGDNQKALAYFEKAYKVNPMDLELLIEYASIQAKEKNEDFSGKPIKLIREALEIDPNLPDALYMSSLHVRSDQKYDLAISLIRRSIKNLPEGSPDIDFLKGEIAEIEQIKAGITPIEGVPTSNRIEINLNIKEETMATRSLEDYLMIYVKSASGRPMPIAIKKIKIKDFKNPIILSDEDSVMPTIKLSQSKNIVVVVRVSESGQAMRQEGDIEVKSEVMERIANNKISLTI
jgi:cytochrome c-type biogenesis protein CcmH